MKTWRRKSLSDKGIIISPKIKNEEIEVDMSKSNKKKPKGKKPKKDMNPVVTGKKKGKKGK